MRRSYVQIGGVLYEKGTEPESANAPMIMADIQPYQSQITGEMITSRSQHRAHLQAHGYREVGNDPSLYRKPAPISAKSKTRKELLIAQVGAMTHEQWKAAGKRDLERLRWNTRGIPDPLKEI